MQYYIIIRRRGHDRAPPLSIQAYKSLTQYKNNVHGSSAAKTSRITCVNSVRRPRTLSVDHEKAVDQATHRE